MQPPKTIWEAKSFLGLVNQMSKNSSDYSMMTTKIRSLLYQGVKFCWSEDHQADFDKVRASISNLDRLEPYHPENDMFVLIYVSLAWLGFVLFQKDSKGRSSILQAGSTSLKHAQIRWNIPELELLAVKYMLNKCHFYTA